MSALRLVQPQLAQRGPCRTSSTTSRGATCSSSWSACRSWPRSSVGCWPDGSRGSPPGRGSSAGLNPQRSGATPGLLDVTERSAAPRRRRGPLPVRLVVGDVRSIAGIARDAEGSRTGRAAARDAGGVTCTPPHGGAAAGTWRPTWSARGRLAWSDLALTPNVLVSGTYDLADGQPGDPPPAVRRGSSPATSAGTCPRHSCCSCISCVQAARRWGRIRRSVIR